MPYYKWRGVGTFRDAAHNREVEPGEVVELTERQAGNHDFVEVDEPDANPTGDGGETGDQNTDDAEDTPESGAEDTPDVDALSEEHWKTVVNAVEDGDVDGALDALEAADDRESVQKAIAERREKL